MEVNLRRRDAACSCGASYQQTQFGGIWGPSACEDCLRRQPRDLTVEAVARAIDAKANRIDQLKVPLEYADASIQTFAPWAPSDSPDRALQERVKRLATRYVQAWPKVPTIVVLRGGNGTGKNHIAWGIAKALVLGYAISMRFTKLPFLLDDLREPWSDRSAMSRRKRLMRYHAVDLLVIDELSAHAEFSRVTPDLYAVLDRRYEDHRATILISNDDNEALGRMLGPALTSRVAGASGIWEFPKARDYRVRRPPGTGA